jgi:uncharacterized protein YjiS (DUF1127 family)
MSTSFGLASIFRATSEMFGRMGVARRRRETARMLEALPEDVLKDIGYRRDYSGQVGRVSREI